MPGTIINNRHSLDVQYYVVPRNIRSITFDHTGMSSAVHYSLSHQLTFFRAVLVFPYLQS